MRLSGYSRQRILSDSRPVGRSISAVAPGPRSGATIPTRTRCHTKLNQKAAPFRGGFLVLNILCWRLPTLPLRVPSVLEGLTAVFGKRTGVTPPTKHQHRVFKLCTHCSRRANKDFIQTENQKASRDSHNSFREFCRGISTPRLNTLLCFHLVPINVVISHGPQTIPYLGVGFPLRCFQRLSDPDIATGRCRWYDSPQTRGQFISVLSY